MANKTTDETKDRADTPPPANPTGKAERTLGNHPVDPNSMGAKTNIPPGVDADALHDPGRQTPGAPKVDNRS